ncbi:MAG: type II toxin-antitoxin system VapC family toxin [Halorientalis sp.]
MTEIETSIGTLTPAHFYGGGDPAPRTCVLGPKFLYALYNPDEEFHDVAYGFLTFVRNEALPYRRFVVNEHVIDEAATRLKKRADGPRAEAFLQALDESGYFDIARLDMKTFEAVRTRFRNWDDNTASFTDFTIGVQMETNELEHVMTFDSDLDLFDVTTHPPLRRD